MKIKQIVSINAENAIIIHIKTIQSGLNSTFNSIETIKLTGGTRKIPVYIYEVRH